MSFYIPGAKIDLYLCISNVPLQLSSTGEIQTMNYTAHLFLSRNYPFTVLGNYLTDMMTIEEIHNWPDHLQSGVRLHHHIDSYTDAHTENKLIKRELRPYFRKYAGVALDLYYDYVLFQNWDLYSEESFGLFENQQYAIIQSQSHFIPERLHHTVGQMIQGRFLHRFTTIEGQSHAFARMDRRARFDTGFDKAIEVMENHILELTDSFNVFFPELVQEVIDFQQNHPSK